MPVTKQLTSTALAYPVLGLFPSGDCELFVDDVSLKQTKRCTVDGNLVLIANDGVVYEAVFCRGKASDWRWRGWGALFRRDWTQLVVEPAVKQYPFTEIRSLVPICLGDRIERSWETIGMSDANPVKTLEEVTSYGQLFAFLSRILL